jgi:predicted nucleotidyltransferase
LKLCDKSGTIIKKLLKKEKGMFMDMEAYLKVVVEKIRSHFNPEKIILFGSYAYGHPTVDSDIDLMIVMRTDEKPHKRAVPIRKVLKGIGIPKDIIVKTPEEFERFKDIIGTIIYPAAHKGKVLYEK